MSPAPSMHFCAHRSSTQSKRRRGRDHCFYQDLPQDKVERRQHQNPGLEPFPKSPLKHQVSDLSPQIQREGLTSARYSTQNFRSSEEPSGTKSKTCITIGYRVSGVCLSRAGCLAQRAVCGTSWKKTKKEAGTGDREISGGNAT